MRWHSGPLAERALRCLTSNAIANLDDFVESPSNLWRRMRTPQQIFTKALPHLVERLDDLVYARGRPRDEGEWHARARAYAETWPLPELAGGRVDGNPLRAFFNARKEGHGIWKWEHYFDVYHRHFDRFRNTDVHILEIGIYSGGSLEMWRDYFGARCRVYGVDVQEECLSYGTDSIQIFIGDQADRDFWRRFRSQVPKLDVVVDDGGHKPDQRASSLEELLPHLSPGGVYVVEDVHGVGNRFGAYASSLVDALNAYHGKPDHRNPERRTVSAATGFQSAVASIHSYPYMTVIEKREEAVAEFIAPKRGTQWEPFVS
jgi:hypothetical protein